MREEIEDEINSEQGGLENEESSVLNGADAIRKNLVDGNHLLDKLKAYKSSDVGLLFSGELDSEYQRLFSEATTTEEPVIAKSRLDRMKGIGFAMGVIDNLIIRLEDDLNNLRENLEYQEAGE